MEFEQILKLIDHVSASRLESFCYESDGLKLTFQCEKQNAPILEKDTMQQILTTADTQNSVTIKENVQPESKTPEFTGNIVKSPLVGTFYAAPSEEAPAFVKIGDKLQKGQVLAIVEAMKLMNDIESDFDGEIAEIYVENGQPVEYGQPLFSIR